MNQDEVWQEVREQLRRYVVSLRDWDTGFVVTHLNLHPRTGKESVALWLADTRRPAGSNLVGLWYMLYEFGLPAPGIDKLDSAVRFAGLLFAFGVDSLENICLKAFGFHGTPQEFYRILRGGQTPKRVVDLHLEYKFQLRRCINEAIVLEQQTVGSDVSIRTLVAAQR